MAWLSNRFVRLGLLVLVAMGFSIWLLGCAAAGTNTQAWAQTTPNGMRLFRICRRHPHVDPNARYWYDVGDGTPRTTFLSLDELLEGREAKAVFLHDPHAPSESRKLLGIAFQHLPCDKPPPPPEKKLAAKEKEDGDKKDEIQEAERPKPLPRPIARCPEPGQARRRGGSGARTCTRTLMYASERSRQPSFRRVEEPPAAEPRPVEAPVPIDPSQVPPGEVRVYEDWRQTPEETALLDRAQECLTGACHARHENFQPKGGKKPAGTHNGQSLSTGSGSGGGAGAPRPAPKTTTVKTTTKPVSKPKAPTAAPATTAPPASAGAGMSGARPSTIEPGPHAGKSVPARGPQRDFSARERAQVNEIGGDTGCHTCGTTKPGTKSGNFVPDHQPPNKLNTTGNPQELYPQCVTCSKSQGGTLRHK